MQRSLHLTQLLRQQAPRICTCWASLPPAHRHSRVSSQRCSASSTSDVPPPNVRQLAELAHIEVTEEQAAAWEPKIRSIVDWFGELQAIDVSGVPPATRPDVDVGNVLRDDQMQQFSNREELMADVPDLEGGYVKVPKIMQDS